GVLAVEGARPYTPARAAGGHLSSRPRARSRGDRDITSALSGRSRACQAPRRHDAKLVPELPAYCSRQTILDRTKAMPRGPSRRVEQRPSTRGTARRFRARSPVAFCLLTALGLLATRLAVVDYRFLTLTTLPPHDMYQGAAFFATNLHALRLEGDLAWWNPTALFGYAQYYQSFLSPLAPTCGHVVFVLWAALIRALGGLGVALPEYPQYLVVTYVVLPLLAFVAFLWVCTLLFTSRAAALLAAIVYAFSGIGLWHSAWFY